MRFAWSVAFLALLGGGAAAAPAPTAAVLTGGTGVLVKCYSWMAGGACNTYHHVTVPRHIALGDTLRVTFGSNLKSFNFPVRRIKLSGERCRIYGDQQSGGIDRLIVGSCQAAALH